MSTTLLTPAGDQPVLYENILMLLIHISYRFYFSSVKVVLNCICSTLNLLPGPSGANRHALTKFSMFLWALISLFFFCIEPTELLR